MRKIISGLILIACLAGGALVTSVLLDPEESFQETIAKCRIDARQTREPEANLEDCMTAQGYHLEKKEEHVGQAPNLSYSKPSVLEQAWRKIQPMLPWFQSQIEDVRQSFRDNHRPEE